MVIAAIAEIDCNKEGHLVDSPQRKDFASFLLPLDPLEWHLVDPNQNIKGDSGNGEKRWNFFSKTCSEVSWTPPTPPPTPCQFLSRTPGLFRCTKLLLLHVMVNNYFPWTYNHLLPFPAMYLIPMTVPNKPILNILKYIYPKHFLCIYASLSFKSYLKILWLKKFFFFFSTQGSYRLEL